MTKLYDITNWPKLGLDETKYPLIGTIDATPRIGRVLDVAGQQFGVGILDRKDRYAGVRPLTAKLVKSPETREFERSDEDTTECQVCGGTIHYQRIVTVEYTTEPVKPPKPIRAHWVPEA